MRIARAPQLDAHNVCAAVCPADLLIKAVPGARHLKPAPCALPRRLDNGVQAPPLHPLPHAELYKGTKIQPEVLRQHLLKEGKITEDDVCRLCKEAMAAFRSEPNIIKLEGNLNIVGDIHGQYYDLMKVFEVRASRACVASLALRAPAVSIVPCLMAAVVALGDVLGARPACAALQGGQRADWQVTPQLAGLKRAGELAHPVAWRHGAHALSASLCWRIARARGPGCA